MGSQDVCVVGQAGDGLTLSRVCTKARASMWLSLWSTPPGVWVMVQLGCPNNTGWAGRY